MTKQYDYLILEKQNTKRAKVVDTELKQDGNVKDTEKEMLIKEVAELKAIISSLKAILKEVSQMSKEQKIYCIIGRAVSLLLGCSVVAGVILATLYYALFCQKGRKNMEAIICSMAGIFIGLTTSWYFQLKPINEKDNKISQLKSENDDLRYKNDDLQEDLLTANRQIEAIKTLLEQNNYGRDDIKIAKIKELVKEFQKLN